jgi:Fur family peroxide stress response transcriptional regulator
MPGPAERDTALLTFAAVCRRQGVPVTPQRRVVLEALLARHDHPTADQLFADVRARLAGVSRTTVYRVLETLVRLGAARKVHHPGVAVRFEARTERHHHLVCTVCGTVADVEAPQLDALRPPDVRRTGFRITDWTVQFAGLCARCRRAAPRHEPQGRIDE